MQKPVLTSKDFMRILDAAHDKFLSSKKLPEDSRELRVYLLLSGLKYHLETMKIELPFEIEDLDKERPEVGGLDDIG